MTTGDRFLTSSKTFLATWTSIKKDTPKSNSPWPTPSMTPKNGCGIPAEGSSLSQFSERKVFSRDLLLLRLTASLTSCSLRNLWQTVYCFQAVKSASFWAVLLNWGSIFTTNVFRNYSVNTQAVILSVFTRSTMVSLRILKFGACARPKLKWPGFPLTAFKSFGLCRRLDNKSSLWTFCKLNHFCKVLVSSRWWSWHSNLCRWRSTSQGT